MHKGCSLFCGVSATAIMIAWSIRGDKLSLFRVAIKTHQITNQNYHYITLRGKGAAPINKHLAKPVYLLIRHLQRLVIGNGLYNEVELGHWEMQLLHLLPS